MEKTTKQESVKHLLEEKTIPLPKFDVIPLKYFFLECKQKTKQKKEKLCFVFFVNLNIKKYNSLFYVVTLENVLVSMQKLALEIFK